MIICYIDFVREQSSDLFYFYAQTLFVYEFIIFIKPTIVDKTRDENRWNIFTRNAGRVHYLSF